MAIIYCARPFACHHRRAIESLGGSIVSLRKLTEMQLPRWYTSPHIVSWIRSVTPGISACWRIYVTSDIPYFVCTWTQVWMQASCWRVSFNGEGDSSPNSFCGLECCFYPRQQRCRVFHANTDFDQIFFNAPNALLNPTQQSELKCWKGRPEWSWFQGSVPYNIEGSQIHHSRELRNLQKKGNVFLIIHVHFRILRRKGIPWLETMGHHQRPT